MLNRFSKHNKEIILNIVGAFIVKGAALIISVLLLPAYLRFFQNEVTLGVWYTILSVLNWVVLFDLGLGQGLRNQLPLAIERNDEVAIREGISTTYALMGVVAVGITIVGLIVIPMLNWNKIFNVQEIIVSTDALCKTVTIVYIGIMLQLVLKIITSILYAIQRSAIVNALGLITNIVIYIALMIIPSKSVEENLQTMAYVNVVAANIPYVFCTIIIFSKELKGLAPSASSVKKRYVKNIFRVGVSLLWLQVVFMVVSSTNEILITSFVAPEYVFEFQAYNKIFKTAAMIISLSLTPIWSAVTRAQAVRNYQWIKKVYKFFLLACIVFFAGELLLVPCLQFVFDLWLGSGVITNSYRVAAICATSSMVFVLHSINTTIGNGLSFFKIQLIWMTVAAIVFVPLAWLMVQMTGGWEGILIANIISLLPYEMIAPCTTIKHVSFMEKQDNSQNE